MSSASSRANSRSSDSVSFNEGSFDLVFGFGILHHLNYKQALSEAGRVLKPGGRILFYEPLGINPLSKLIRRLTPQARTKDEKPLGYEEFEIIDEFFETKIYYEQFLSVPLGVLSPFLYGNPKNPITKLGFKIDRLLDKQVPFVRPHFRFVIIEGIKR